MFLYEILTNKGYEQFISMENITLEKDTMVILIRATPDKDGSNRGYYTTRITYGNVVRRITDSNIELDPQGFIISIVPKKVLSSDKITELNSKFGNAMSDILQVIEELNNFMPDTPSGALLKKNVMQVKSDYHEYYAADTHDTKSVYKLLYTNGDIKDGTFVIADNRLFIIDKSKSCSDNLEIADSYVIDRIYETNFRLDPSYEYKEKLEVYKGIKSILDSTFVSNDKLHDMLSID